MHLFFTITIVIALAIAIHGNNLPDEFFGTFSLDHSENFDEYLAAKGVNWIVRRIILLMNVDVVFSKAGENSFNYDFLTALKDVHVKNIVLGHAIEVETMNKRLSNILVKLTYTLRRGLLYVSQVPIDPKARRITTDHDMEIEARFKVDGDTLVLTLHAEGIVANQYFNRQQFAK